MGFFEPAWMTDDTNKLQRGLNSVRRIKDGNKLKRAATNARRHEIRVAAMEKLDDQAILADLAKNASLSDIRRQAAVKLNDQNVIADVAKNDENPTVRSAAIEKLTDQSALTEIVKKEKDKGILLLVVGRLTDQNTLVYVTQNYDDWKIRYKAALKLNDKALAQAVYADIVKDEDLGDGKRMKIVEQLSDQNALAYVAKLPSAFSKKVWAMRELALGKITEPSILADIAKNATEETVREAARKKLAVSAK
ncbi:MAG: hypothetical protein FWH07_01975 [Oscillospiraceae bacterium]|nr:hypothetical protein [Oscillospiraceae bacterium]